VSNFVGLGDLAKFMNVAEAALNTALADLALQAAQAAIRGYIDQTITLVTNDVEVLDGYGKPWLRLHERPVRAVSKVEEGDGTTASFVEIPTTDWVLRRSLIFRVDGGVWLPGNVNYRVTYTHGWDTGSVDSDTSDSDFDPLHVPADISLVALNTARRLYGALGTSDGVSKAGNIKQETIGAYSYTLSTVAEQVGAAAGVELLLAEKMVLDRYRYEGAG